MAQPLNQLVKQAKQHYEAALKHEMITIDTLLTDMVIAHEQREYQILKNFDVSQRLDGRYYSKLSATLERKPDAMIHLRIVDRTVAEDNPEHVLYDGWLTDANINQKKLIFDCLHTSYFKQMHTEQYNLRTAWHDLSRSAARTNV